MTVIAFPSLEKPFLHVLAPLPEESLLSFMLRLDVANGWAIGETAKLVSIHTTGWRRATAEMWASGTIWDLPRLARLTRNPLEAIEALTYLHDLRAASADPEVGIRALGDAGLLRFCPVCLATTGAIPRFCFLPLLDICPLHGVRMELFCPAHRSTYGDFYADPPVVENGSIVCVRCGRVISSPEGRRVDEEALAHLRDTWRAWTFLLGWRGDDIRGRGYRTIRAVRRGYPLRNLADASFEHLVTVFLALQIEPELVATLEDVPTSPCPNAACPRYVAPGPDDPLERERPVERHCAECGARFVGRRILLCFDSGHGGAYPSARSVRKARRRLRRWRQALAEACRSDILAGRRITVTGTFGRAGVPLNANLRASRLGLVALVRDAARRQRLVEHREPAPFDPISMAEYRVIRDAALGGRWRDLFEAAKFGWIRPNEITPPHGWYPGDFRRDARQGVLDPLFPPAWVLRKRVDPEAMRSRIADVGEGDHWSKYALTRNWSERINELRESGQCGPVVPTSAFPQNVSLRYLRPEVAAFVRSEWSADWLSYYLESCRSAPPSLAPFG
jgi:hypothetical protein